MAERRVTSSTAASKSTPTRAPRRARPPWSVKTTKPNPAFFAEAKTGWCAPTIERDLNVVFVVSHWQSKEARHADPSLTLAKQAARRASNFDQSPTPSPDQGPARVPAWVRKHTRAA